MKVAIVHDYIKEYGGAERVLEALHEIWPEAPIYTTVYLPEFLGPHRERFEGRLGGLGKLGRLGTEKAWDIRTSFLQYLPFKAKLISPIRLIAPWVFRQFDFSEFDVVIVSATGAYIPNAIKVKSQSRFTSEESRSLPRHLAGEIGSDQRLKTSDQRPIHVCYCHTPPRYLYGYATAREWKKNVLFRVMGEIANHFLRLVDYKAAQNVDYFIANSNEVSGRIKKFYRKSSTVIYPPINMINTDLLRINTDKDPRKSVGNPCKSYYLTGGRLARAKHTDLIIEACQKAGVQLKVFGRGFGGNEFKVQSSKFKVEYLGEVSDQEKFELMKNAKAFIFAGEDEDFGITPVEAMSVGTPVIAYRSGGVKETVVDGKTGIFFDELTVESLTKAMKHYDDTYHHSGFKPSDCVAQTRKFSKERFKKEIKGWMEKVKKENIDN